MKHRKPRDPHVGGEQLPLIVPHTDWQVPTELPDLTGRGPVEVAWDTETKDEGLSAKRGPGWARRAGFVAGVGVAWDGGRQSMYVPVQHPDTQCLPKAQVAAWIRHHWASPDVRCVFHNAPYDVGWIGADLGVPPPAGAIDDTGGMAYMIDENRLNYGLDALCRSYGLPGKDETLLKEAAAAYGRDPKIGLWRLPARFVGAYGAGDPAATLRLAAVLRPQLVAQDVERAYQLEMDIVPLCVAMQRRGIRINVDAAEAAARQIDGRLQQVLAELGSKLGLSEVSIEHVRSAKVLEDWFRAAGVPYPVTPKTGVGSFRKEWMRPNPHWLPQGVDRARRLHDAANKFIRGFLIAYSHDGRVHAVINQFRTTDDTEDEGQHGTVSYRFSYSDPPLQQMPARDEEISAIVRGAFEPEPGETWGAADYSQQEYRLGVHYAAAFDLPGAAEAMQRYRDDPSTDFHAYVAEITGLERKPAKDSNFAKMYGAGVPKFALMIGKSVEEAQAIYDQYDRELPFVSRLASAVEKIAQQRGYIKLLDGARSRFDFWESYGTVDPETGEKLYLRATTRDNAVRWADNVVTTRGVRPRIRRADTRKALNRLIQGGAARQTKMAMRDCWRAGIAPLLQLHDELGLSLASERQGQQVVEIMRSVEASRLLVPFLVDIEYGSNWGNARKVKATGYRATWAEAQALRAA